MIDAIFFDWPFLGVAAALALFAGFFFRSRAPGAPPPWRDPYALLGLMLPVYMLHQFEEHGVDLLGHRYPFREWFCTALGMLPLERCAADPAFILAVNVGAVWIAGALAFVFRRTHPMVAACAWSIPLLNAVAHAHTAVRERAYNPGLLTGLVLFIPLSVYVLRTAIRARVIELRTLPVVIIAGVVLHGILIGGLMADAHGLIPHGVDVAVQALNGFLPLAFGFVLKPAPAARLAT